MTNVPDTIRRPIPGYPGFLAIYQFVDVEEMAPKTISIPSTGAGVPSIEVESGLEGLLSGMSTKEAQEKVPTSLREYFGGTEGHKTYGAAMKIPGTDLHGDDPRVLYIAFPRQDATRGSGGFTLAASKEAVARIYGVDLRRAEKSNKSYWIFLVHPKKDFRKNANPGIVRAMDGVILSVGDIRPSAFEHKLPSVYTIPGYQPQQPPGKKK